MDTNCINTNMFVTFQQSKNIFNPFWVIVWGTLLLRVIITDKGSYFLQLALTCNAE